MIYQEIELIHLTRNGFRQNKPCKICRTEALILDLKNITHGLNHFGKVIEDHYSRSMQAHQKQA